MLFGLDLLNSILQLKVIFLFFILFFKSSHEGMVIDFREEREEREASICRLPYVP